MAPAETPMSRSKVEAAGRLPSMECEPKTLTLDQIKLAKEAALYVMNTKTEEEAIRIFTEGLKPVKMKTVRMSSSFDSSSDDEVELGGSSDGATRECSSGGCRHSSKGGARGGGHHRGCCCRRRSRSIERDVATAPF
ncbi:hypothetical protein HU200_032904 [Digitaria exilis]|uniref:Uncharacterized protein n=1 Tax=Digitaria exilis TaxID=1010633 RepID=A0A835BMH1_9POAL|nr:hypothetical protein HU200_032904 [Digitaria exilis]CAB3487983.1 unnamed protein product [Digitaria exilis]